MARRLNPKKINIDADEDFGEINVSETDQIEKLDLGTLNPKQIECVDAILNGKAKYVCYGGAKGGGKTHLDRVLAILFAVNLFPGIRILVVRSTFDDVRQNHIEPTIKMLPDGWFSYNGSTHQITFWNGSTIQYGNWAGMDSETKYQGQEYDFIEIDEATQFTERMFRHLAACLRGTKKGKTKLPDNFKRKILLTCNPGGIGHFWVKRLFIDQRYKQFSENEEENEDPEEYQFIFARAEDNVENLKENPDYLKIISQMANSKAMRYGDWNQISGQYFENFDEKIHTVRPFGIPAHWERYRSFDYGLDMFACFWWAVDEDGRNWCIRSFEKSDLNVPDAAKEVLNHTLKEENINVTFAPPDMWSRQKDTGRTMAEIFLTNGVSIIKSDNNRVQGHMIMRTLLDPIPLRDKYVRRRLGIEDGVEAELPALMFFDNVGQCLEDIQSIQADEKNPNDCAKQPHDVTHTVDGIRYFCINRSLSAEQPKVVVEFEEEEFRQESYEEFLYGGELTQSYLYANGN